MRGTTLQGRRLRRIEFLRNGSGYILDRVALVSVHIAGYDLSPQTSSKEQREQEQEEFEETL